LRCSKKPSDPWQKKTAPSMREYGISLGGLINKIRQVYQQENGFRQESILMRDVSEKLAELWDTALIEKHGGEVKRSDSIQYEVRELDDGRKIA
jgi:hypothetical protein